MPKFRDKYKQSYKWETVYCYICGTAITDKRDYSLDHEPPKSRQDELGRVNCSLVARNAIMKRAR